MKAVNLIPSDGRTRRRGSGGLPLGYLVVAGLAAVLALVTVSVLTGNTISERRAKVSSLEQQLASEQAKAARLADYAQFAKLAQARAETVRQIAATRFDWYSALSELSRVVPANTSLNWLYGSVAPGATIAGGGTAGSGIASTLRGDLSVPAFELNGCTKTQDDVARLMSRLRLINGVTRVTLGDSQKPDSGQSSSSATSSSTPTTQYCGPDAPSFDLVVFFQALLGAGPNGVATSATTSGATAPSRAASAAPRTPAATAAPTTPVASSSASSSSAPAVTPMTTPVSTGGKP